jgi:hypothetical protein
MKTINYQDAALLAAFHRLDPLDREPAIANLEYHARTAEIQSKRTAAEPPGEAAAVPIANPKRPRHLPANVVSLSSFTHRARASHE